MLRLVQRMSTRKKNKAEKESPKEDAGKDGHKGKGGQTGGGGKASFIYLFLLKMVGAFSTSLSLHIAGAFFIISK